MNINVVKKYSSLLFLFLRRYIHLFFNKFLKPRSQTEDDIRREFVLNVILLGSIALLTLLGAFIVYHTVIAINYTGVSILLFSGILIFFIILYILSRKGFFIIASYGLIFIYLLGTTLGAFHWGPDLYQILLTYALIIIMSSVLISTRFGFIVTFFIFFVLVTVTTLDKHHLIVLDRQWTLAGISTNDAVELGVSYLLITVISWLSNRETEKSLRRARSSEHALKEKNESLEHIVEERTKALREAQSEKVSQLYRFAEFGKLSSGIFHDLMNPLSIVASNVEHLKTTVHPEIKDIKNYITRAVDASKRMEQFITTVRKQIQTTENNQKFLMGAEVKEVMSLLNYKALKQGITLKFRSQRDISTFGNPLKFQQIVSNLISNAIDSYEKSPRHTQEKQVVVKIMKKEDTVEISISDKGSGIDSLIIAKIFDPFFTTKGPEKGMGLGLSNTKNIIEKDFNGTIIVSSALHQGSEFIVTIPLIKDRISN